MFYVYEWFIVQTGEIIYVGKGCGNRYKVRKHNRFFNDMIARYECKSRVVREFESEKDAFAYEFDRVRELKELGQCVCNIYNGGAGGTTSWWTDEMRERYSERNVMKSEAMRKRMSENNPMRDKAHAMTINAKKRVKVVIDGTLFESVTKASEEYGVSPNTIRNWCIKGYGKDGIICHYDGDKLNEKYVPRKSGKNRPLEYLGAIYESTGIAARTIGVSQSTVARWCRQGHDSNGLSCKYVDDDRTFDGLPKSVRAVPVVVNGVRYDSKEDAAREVGISTSTISRILDGKQRSTKYICEYGNQQPSRGNADNSTTEGSETNR